MKKTGIIGITVAICAAILFALVSGSGSSDLTPQIVKDSKYGLNNNAVHMVGCQALPEPVAPKVLRPSVVRTFVSLPCATEVPPPVEAIEYMKRSEVE